MPRAKSCAILSLVLALPALASGSIHFANHTQTCNSCGDNAFYHADLNNDAFEDLVYIQDLPNSSNTTFVVKFANNDGSGTYSAGTSYQVPPYNGSPGSISALALGDFFHTGSIDIVAFTWNSGKAYVYHNNGKGVFTLSGSFVYTSEGQNVGTTSAAVADFNRDGNLDLAFIVSGQLHVFTGDGKGGFTSGLAQSVNAIDVAMGDFDGDGNADLLIHHDAATTTAAYIYYGDGTGHFPDSVTINTPGGIPWFSVGDVNSDGKSDVMAVAPDYAPSRVFVFYGDAIRQLASRTTILVGRCLAANSAQVADMDGNGLNDLIVEEDDCSNPNTGPLYVDVLTRNPDSSYNPDQTVYWAQKAPDGNTYEISQLPVILRADQDSSPDLLVQQCNDQYCYNHINTTQLNTTSGNWNSCSAPWAAEGITVCSPLVGNTAYSPVEFQIAAAGPVPMRDVEVWVDGSKVAEQIDGFSYYTYLDRYVSLNPGTHNVTIFAAGWDQSLVKKSFTLNVQ